MPVRPRRNPEIVWRLEKGMHELAWDRARKGEEYEDLGVLTLMVNGAIHLLNLVGAEIWTRINGINTGEKIAAQIAPLFHADPGEMQADVMGFLKDIEENGWVMLSEGSDHAAPKWTEQ
jgi:pyrroloquinoline quinone biosynthesis protein D